MDNLEEAIRVLSKRVSVQEILKGNLSSAHIPRKEFVQLMRCYSDKYSETELENLYWYLSGDFSGQFEDGENRDVGGEKLDVFQLLRHYSEWILTEQDNEIVCEYTKLLHWRVTTKELSEDLFTSSFLASKTVKNRAEPKRFDWKAVVTHNNWELHKILGQGMAENHSHLKGTSAVFPLTWISLMNHVNSFSFEQQLEEIDKNRRNVEQNCSPSGREESLNVQALQAACIRFLLFRWVCCDLWEMELPEKERKFIFWLRNPNSLLSIRGELAAEIHTYQNVLAGEVLADYAIAGLLEEGCQGGRLLIFQGERWLMYHLFYAIYVGKKLGQYRDLFYAYLVLKEKIRAEFVQNNQKVGFENFQIYEKRKDVFLESPFYKKEMVKKAVEASLIENRAVVMEARIAPKDTAEKYVEDIRRMDSWLNEDKIYQGRMFYTVHFIKSADIISAAVRREYVNCRHYGKRQSYRRQALSLAEFREFYPDCAGRIRGIDAANMEIGCGPEVFAQVFRYLSDHVVGTKGKAGSKVPQLRKTYHVGEDFLDFVSGLRAIDETVHFLGMQCGDRLGHAIVLGIDPKEWYQGKNYRILLSQQEYLDNVAWMYHLGVEFHIDNSENILDFLKMEYEYYFQRIYRNAMDANMLEHIRNKAKRYYKDTEKEKYYNGGVYDFSIENYYSAWELRGDAPELYRDGFFASQDDTVSRYRSFSYYAVNRKFPKEEDKRHIQEIALLYHYYHFDVDVRKEGERRIEKKIGRQYIKCARMLQYELQKVIAESGIGIETNPSSNVLISTFKRYDRHPILSFYNKDLEEDEEKLRRCPQISVSINTDDAGIFGTSLENEYAYMALALEKAKDGMGNPRYKKRNIYEWLDHIRVMGLRQTFLSVEEMRDAEQKWSGQAGLPER